MKLIGFIGYVLWARTADAPAKALKTSVSKRGFAKFNITLSPMDEQHKKTHSSFERVGSCGLTNQLESPKASGNSVQ
jgi:hypothetical protein